MSAREAEPFLAAVARHADAVLREGRGRWGQTSPALFADALNVVTRQPPRWLHPADGHEMVLSNAANQQDLFRTLVGLSALTGEERYAAAAKDAVRACFAQARDPGDLLYWGGHWAYDLIGGEPFGMDSFHELKTHYPFYELMWSVDPGATRSFIEAFWDRHILDWGNLDMNRHGEYGPRPPAAPPWSHSRDLAPVFFVGRGLSFKNTGSDLSYAAALLGRLTGEPGPHRWALAMAQRYVDTRDPHSGLGGYQYSQIAGDRAALQFGAEFGERAREHTVLDRMRATRTYGDIVLCQLALAECLGLGDAGASFLRWAREDLLAFARRAYDPETNTLHAILRDGTRLTPSDVKRPGYYQPETFSPYPAGPLFFWAYAKAFRLTGDTFLGSTASAIARGLGLGDVQTAGITVPAASNDAWTLLGLLELHRASRRSELLHAASAVGHNLLRDRFVADLFVTSAHHLHGRLGAEEPLALLHLVAALRGEAPETVPTQLPGKKYFTAHWWKKGRTSDYLEWFPQLRD
jgi:pectate lyase